MPSTLIVDTYAQRGDIEQVFGKTNTVKWADLDGMGVKVDIDARIKWALETSYAELHDRLRNGPITIPMPAPYPRTLVRVQAQMAGVWLYESRGITDNQEGNHQLAWHKKEIARLITDIHAGKLIMEGSIDTPVPFSIPGDSPGKSILGLTAMGIGGCGCVAEDAYEPGT